MVQINMKMPERCDECKFMDVNYCDYPYCTALREHRGYNFAIHNKRFPNCPLNPIEEETKKNSEEDEKDHIIRVLFNRCRAVGSCNGALCVFCGLKKECEEYGHNA